MLRSLWTTVHDVPRVMEWQEWLYLVNFLGPRLKLHTRATTLSSSRVNRTFPSRRAKIRASIARRDTLISSRVPDKPSVDSKRVGRATVRFGIAMFTEHLRGRRSRDRIWREEIDNLYSSQSSVGLITAGKLSPTHTVSHYNTYHYCFVVLIQCQSRYIHREHKAACNIADRIARVILDVVIYTTVCLSLPSAQVRALQ